MANHATRNERGSTRSNNPRVELGHCEAGNHLVLNDELVPVKVMAATHLSPAEYDEVCIACLEAIADQPDYDVTDPRI